MNTTPDKPVRKHTRAWLIALLLAFIAVGGKAIGLTSSMHDG